MKCNNTLFTGFPGCGKTTLIDKIVNELKDNATGFITSEIREKGKRTGFSINTLDGKQALMAHVTIRSKYKVGKYGVDLLNIENIAVPSMIPDNSKQFVIINEIANYYINLLFEKVFQ